MSAIRKDQAVKAAPPKASKQVERDSAKRYRSVPASKCVIRKGRVDVPLEYMLTLDEVWKKGGTTLVELVQSLLVRVDMLEKSQYAGWTQPDAEAAHEVVHKAEVIPMAEAKPDSLAAKWQAQQARSKAGPGFSVPGNEAEELVFDPDAPVEVDSKPTSQTSDNVVQLLPAPKPEAVVNVEQSAANDDENLGDEVWLEDLRKQFSFSAEDVANMMRKEYVIRNSMTIRKHGCSYEELKARRAELKEGVAFRERGESVGLWFKAKNSRYGEMIRKWESHPDRVFQRQYDEAVALNAVVDAKRQERREARRKVEIKGNLKSAAFQRELKFVMVDRLAKVKAKTFSLKAWWKAGVVEIQDGVDSARRLLRLPIPDRQSRKLAKMAKEYEKRGEELYPRHVAADTTTPIAVLVRRCQRQGIGH